jgi:Flp pilus assembly protein TadD
MNRYFVRTAAVVFCATWAAACGSDGASSASNAASAAPVADASANEAPTTLDAEIAKAHVLRTQGDYDAAGKSFAQLMLVAPDDVRVVGEYGKVLAQQGRPADAIPFLKRALELQQSDWTLYSALGVADDQIDDHVSAKLAYEHALSLKPGEAAVLNNYAVSRMLAGDLNGAQRLLAQASSSGDADPKIAENLAVLAGMKRPASVVAVTPQSDSPTITVSASHPTNPKVAEVETQKVPVDTQRTATAGPRVIANIEMERVPVDPLAGPVVPKSASQHKLAQTTAHQTKVAATLRHASVPAASAPVLRTAAENQ